MTGEYTLGEISKLFSKNSNSSNSESISLLSKKPPIVPQPLRVDRKNGKRKSLEDTTVDEKRTKKKHKLTKKSSKIKSTQLKEYEDALSSEKEHVKQKEMQSHSEDVKALKQNTKVFNEDEEKEKLSRTLFVGNLPSSFTKKQIKSLFSEYGKLQSIRIRNVIPGKPTLTKKVAVITKNFHPERECINAYVVFKTVDKATKGLELNGLSVEGNYIRVDFADNKDHNHKCSVFVGNLPFGLTDDELRTFFQDCGEIQSIRIIRDKATGAGKGFGYVEFKEESSIIQALKKHDEKLANRNIRVFRAKKEKVKHAGRTSQTPTVKSNTSKYQFKFLKNADWMGKKKSNNFEGERSVENVKERVRIQKNIKISAKNAKLHPSKGEKYNVLNAKTKKQ